MRCMFFGLEGRGLSMSRIEDLTGGKKEPVIIPSENGTFWIDFEDKQ